MLTGKTLRLVRHALPLIDPGTCYGSLDVPADPVATEAAARSLAPHLPDAAIVRCSPLQRCVQLAEALQRLRADLDIRLDPRLAEIGFGTWEGRSWDSIGQAAVDAWAADFAHHAPGGGEHVSGFIERVSAAFGDAARAGGNATWITHAGVIRAAMLVAAGRSSITRAAQWPAEAPAFGGWTLLPLQGHEPSTA